MVVPTIFLFVGVLFMYGSGKLPQPAMMFAPYAPYIVAAIAGVLGLWFKRIRVLLMAGMLSGVHWTLMEFPPGSSEYNLLIIFAAIAALFPINAIVLATMRDCSLWSLAVLSRILFVLAQISVVAVIWGASDVAKQNADNILHFRIFDKALDYWTVLPQPAVLLFGIAILIFMARAVYTSSAIDGGMTGAVACTAMAMHGAVDGETSSIIIALGAVVLVVSVVQDIYKMAFIDELTSLPGRRALIMDLDTQGSKYSLAMLDVDHFKKFNDTYGHDVGDQVLKLVASKMMKVQGGGKAYRYGGEEFTILFPGKSLDHALVHLEAVRKAIGGSHFRLRSDDRPKDRPKESANKNLAKKSSPKAKQDLVNVTISIGAVERVDGQKPMEAMKQADEALYRAKDGGRNRVSR